MTKTTVLSLVVIITGIGIHIYNKASLVTTTLVGMAFILIGIAGLIKTEDHLVLGPEAGHGEVGLSTEKERVISNFLEVLRPR
jgi:hypothetical protein